MCSTGFIVFSRDVIHTLMRPGLDSLSICRLSGGSNVEKIAVTNVSRISCAVAIWLLVVLNWQGGLPPFALETEFEVFVRRKLSGR